jgi:2-keto-4-pentenoate hydratase/2-oxohepta-3-ene-1,7-dioic acid hydratase in catechol pathway
MQFVSFNNHGDMELGVINGAQVMILPRTLGDLADVVAAGPEGLEEVRASLSATDLRQVALADIEPMAPLRRFRRDILCTGWNYHAHFEESIGKRGAHEVERPTAPTFFTKAPNVVIGPRDPIAFDAGLSQCWDYEAEIAVIIGRDIFSPTVEEAETAVFGYCLANDVSQRDLQRRHGGQWLKGKSIDGTMPFGPFVVTADEVDLSQVILECLVNGKTRQRANASQMAFSVGELIAELAFGMTLRAGDVLLTGTPSGIGSARVPPVYLADGDEVVVRATGLGELRNVVRATDLTRSSPVRTRLAASS